MISQPLFNLFQHSCNSLSKATKMQGSGKGQWSHAENQYPLNISGDLQVVKTLSFLARVVVIIACTFISHRSRILCYLFTLLVSNDPVLPPRKHAIPGVKVIN